jgi:Domain of unknown function (DUF4375)
MARRETVHVQVDDSTIAAGDPGAVMHPVWWSANIYDGPVAYEKSLEQFSRSQRLVFAVLWYIREVNNGGHRQFYSNSTGIVWKDALEGFEALGIPRAANILRISAERMGGSPSLDRGERNEQLMSHEPDFKDLDEAFWDLQEKANLDDVIMRFIRAQPADFYFSGTIERVVLPGR